MTALCMIPDSQKALSGDIGDWRENNIKSTMVTKGEEGIEEGDVNSD